MTISGEIRPEHITRMGRMFAGDFRRATPALSALHRCTSCT